MQWKGVAQRCPCTQQTYYLIDHDIEIQYQRVTQGVNRLLYTADCYICGVELSVHRSARRCNLAATEVVCLSSHPSRCCVCGCLKTSHSRPQAVQPLSCNIPTHALPPLPFLHACDANSALPVDAQAQPSSSSVCVPAAPRARMLRASTAQYSDRRITGTTHRLDSVDESCSSGAGDFEYSDGESGVHPDFRRGKRARRNVTSEREEKYDRDADDPSSHSHDHSHDVHTRVTMPRGFPYKIDTCPISFDQLLTAKQTHCHFCGSDVYQHKRKDDDDD